MKRVVTVVVALFAAASVSLAAQWPKHPAPGLPRDAKGQVQMDAPPPRIDGHPDLSGVWLRADREPIPAQLEGIVGTRKPEEGGVALDREIEPFPPDPKSPPVATFFELPGTTGF